MSRFRNDIPAAHIVPRSGYSARLSLIASLAMAFLTVFAMALSFASARLAEQWHSELSNSTTVRISAPADQMDIQTQAAMSVLQSTPGIQSARVLEESEQLALLEPWFGPDLPLDSLPIPKLIEVIEDSRGYDAEGLRLRLAGEAPGAILDDHTRWREPLVVAAGRLRTLGATSILLILMTVAIIVHLASSAALAANEEVIRVLRLIGAQDTYIARAFVRRFTLRAFVGGALGTGLGLLGVAYLPEMNEAGGFLTGLGFQELSWIYPLFIPFIVALIAFWATRAAAFRALRRVR